MASKFQSRLIGTVILVAIGVIVLPDVFDGKKEHYQEEFAAIPIKPTDDVAEISNEQIKEPVALDISLPKEPVAVVTAQSISDDEKAIKPKEVGSKVVKSSEPVKPSESAQSEIVQTTTEQKNVEPQVTTSARETNQYANSAWIIQLAALKNYDNAEKLVSDLQKRGFKAHLKQENSINRVIVGPDISKQKLEQQIDQLQKITGLKGQIRTFKPLN